MKKEPRVTTKRIIDYHTRDGITNQRRTVKSFSISFWMLSDSILKNYDFFNLRSTTNGFDFFYISIINTLCKEL